MYRGECIISIASAFLPSAAKLVMAQKPYKVPVVFKADIDGDTIQEIIAVYSYSGNIYSMVLKNHSGKWRLLANIKGKGYSVSNLMAAPITQSKINNLIIGWQIDKTWSELEIYKLTEQGLVNIANKNMIFSKIDLGDMPGKNGMDGKYEIALWSHETDKAYNIEIYKWDNENLVVAKDLYPYYFKKVISYYEKLIDESPNSPIYWYYLGDSQVKSGMVDAGLKSIDKALEFSSPYPSEVDLLKLKKNLLSQHS